MPGFRLLLAPLALAAILISAAQAMAGTGFRQFELADPSGSRALQVSLWYPSEDGGTESSLGENRAFYGVPVIKNAAATQRTLPLVVLSHGYGGSWRNLSWLADVLSRSGYIVAAPDHPGTTTLNKDPKEAARLWERPRDLSRVIDALIRDNALAGKVEPSRIASIGHSLGGWTVTALTGGRFSTERFARECKLHPNPRICRLNSLRADEFPPASVLNDDMRDMRVRAMVSLDLGLARGFTPESLAALPVPALIIGAGTDIGDLPARLESGYLAEHLPASGARYVEIPDAMHFSFMQRCKPEGAALLEADEPGDGIVCKDGGTRGRDAIHQEVAALILGFFAKAIPTQ
ncbi:alpha/beta hydrolase family protein [Bosea sp. BH3]|uniref:alpha/beta hydrolase family protein n=1 Tax=Bosea sp. BH3 TaxID=2871701 RepID=UPI0021CB16ED|nr:alpha/beta fold hydrolase [Bosea sp. BH3]MCU4180282.1 alpha/beta fold hydrolase [Bosea sp. BH3]